MSVLCLDLCRSLPLAIPDLPLFRLCAFGFGVSWPLARWTFSPTASQEAEGVLASGLDLAVHQRHVPLLAALSAQGGGMLTG